MHYLYRSIRVLYSVYAFIIFLAVLLLIFPIVIVASLFGKVKGGNFIYDLCRVWADIFFFCAGIRHRNIYETPHDRQQQYVFVFNHISYLDGPILVKAIRRQHFRALGKAELARLPIFGFVYRSIVVMVERDNPEKRAQSVVQLKEVLKKGISITLSPEGTFNIAGKPLKEFYDGAFKIAIETQTPIKPILFLDAYDRLHYRNAFSLTPGRSRAVFLEEVRVDGLRLEDTAFLKAKVYDIMEKKLIAYKASWIKGAEAAE